VTTEPFAQLLSDVRRKLEPRLGAVMEREIARHAKTGAEVTRALQRAADVGKGGKRLRAALVCVGQACFEAPSAKGRKLAIECGLAVELLQTYFLVHDDWMDKDDTRRGVVAVHAGLASDFDSEHKGAAGAVLAGDYLVALASLHLTRTLAQHPGLALGLECFAQMQLAAVAGQQLDVIGITRNAERVYELKTASYTVQGPLELGAILANAPSKAKRALVPLASALGVAFQIQDDLLGAFGAPEVTGKPRGNDLVQGKWTWLVERALERANGAEQNAIERVLGNPKAKASEIAKATAALETSGAVELAKARITALTAECHKRVARLDVRPEGKALLTGSITALLERNH
jgi:geranylgeranyl diphosphate synthase type I